MEANNIERKNIMNRTFDNKNFMFEQEPMKNCR